MRIAPWRGLLVAAALILTGAAILHVTAFPTLSRALNDARLDAQWVSALDGLWFMFAIHIVFIAAFLVHTAVRVRVAADSGLLVCALILAADTALLGGFLGLFAGTLLLGIATALVIIARLLRQAALAT